MGSHCSTSSSAENSATPVKTSPTELLHWPTILFLGGTTNTNRHIVFGGSARDISSEKKSLMPVVDSIDGFRFEFVEGHRRDLENVEKSTAYDKRIECCPICC
jgi:hypothetical protein